MEYQYSSSLVIMLLLIAVVAKIYRKKMNAKNKVPPGPWKLPLIGNLHQLALAGSTSLPHHVLRDLSLKYGPLMHLQLGQISTLVVSSPHMAKQILNTHDLAFAQRPQLLSPNILAYDSTDIAFAPYGHYWRQMRKICTLELLSAKRVQSFSFIRQHEVTNLVQSIHHSSSGSSPINISALLFSLVFTLVSREAFGKKPEHEDELLSLVKEASVTMGGFDLADLFPSLKPIHLITRMKAKLEDMHRKVDNILETIVREHQQNIRARSNEDKGEENLIDVLLHLQQSSTLEIPVTVNNIKAVIWDIFGGGTDTSATVLEWAMSELMKNPRVMEKAQNEIREAMKGKETIKESDLHKLSYLKAVIKESMRLHPPAPLLLPRECREACNIGGYDIAVKTKVIVNAWAIGRDPNHWYNADSFMPERFHGIETRGNEFEYIPFGAGRRMCPGISFGLANVELPLAALLYHFNWELPNGIKPQDLDMTEAFGAGVRRRNDLYLLPAPYHYGK